MYTMYTHVHDVYTYTMLNERTHNEEVRRDYGTLVGQEGTQLRCLCQSLNAAQPTISKHLLVSQKWLTAAAFETRSLECIRSK